MALHGLAGLYRRKSTEERHTWGSVLGAVLRMASNDKKAKPGVAKTTAFVSFLLHTIGS